MPERLPTPDRTTIETLIRGGKFVSFPDRVAQTILRNETTPLRLDQLDNGTVIKASLHSVETVGMAIEAILSRDTKLAADQAANKFAKRKQADALSERLHFKLIDAAMTEVQATANIDISAAAVANLVAGLHRHELGMRVSGPDLNRRGDYEDMQRYQGRFIEQVGKSIKAATTLPAELSGPQDYARLMKGIQTGLQLDDETRNVATMAVGIEIRDRLCRAWEGADYDGYAVEEYRASALLYSPDQQIRASLLNDETGLVDGFRKHPIWLEYMQKFSAPDTGVSDYPTAIIDPQHPRHREARRIFRLYLSGTSPRESVPYALNMAAFGADVTESKKGPELMRGLGQRATMDRLPLYDQTYQEIFGPAAKGIMDKGRLALMAALAGGATADWRNSLPNLRRSPDIKITTLKQSDGYVEWRAVNVVQPDDERTRDLIPELTPEQELALTTLANALAADIQESTIALPTFITADQQRTLAIQPLPDQFPAIDLEAATAEILTKIHLDEQLQVALSTDSARARQLTTALRAIALAVLHDQVLAVQKVQVAEPRTQAAAERPDTPPKPKPTRIHKARNFIVIGEKAEDEQTVQHTIQEHATDGQAVMLTVDRRPHWSDRAPQLTTEARRHALQHWLSEVGEPSQPYAEIVTQALTQEGAHRLTVRRILESLMQQERQGKKLLPPNFPLHQAIERLTELSDDRYHTLLNQYVGEESAAGPLPNVYKMSQRMEADRAKMAELGVETMSMPPRLRETETYMPFSRYETPVKLGKLGNGKVRNYTIMRGSSASEAVQRILNS